MALSIPVEGTTIDNSYFTSMISEINKKAEFHLLATGGSSVSADDWEDDKQNWQSYDAYSQYDFLVFSVRARDACPQTLWIKTSDITDDGAFYLNWMSYQVPQSSYIQIYYYCLGWTTSYVAGHTHGGDLSDNTNYCGMASVKLQSSTPSFSKNSLNYKDRILSIYGVKI